MDRIALAGVAGLGAGILVASNVSIGWSGSAACVLVAAALYVLYRWKNFGACLLASVCIVGFALGCVRMAFVPTTFPDSFLPLVDTQVRLEGKIVAEPDVRETVQRVTVEVEQGGERVRLLAVAPLYPEVSYGEQVSIGGMLEHPEPFATDAGRVFAYDRFLAKDGVFLIVRDAHLSIAGKREGMDHLYGSLLEVKRIGMRSLAAALPEPQASLASGLILGGKQGLGEELLDDFIRSGLVHIVVLSGYNVMIVAEFVLRFFGFLPKRRAAGIAALTIGMFVLIAGAGAASVRAGIMAGIALYARATGRTYDALRALVCAGVVMVLLSPLSLAYDPGFQLSFIATLGLIFGAPIVAEKLSFIKSNFMREIISSTIAAQIAVLPLLLFQNGLFSLVALPANILVLPLVPLAMLASFGAGLAGFLVPTLSPVFGLPAYLLLSYITSVVEIASALPLAAFSVPAFPLYITIAAYAAMAWFAWRRFTLPIQAHVSRSRSS